MFPLQAVELTPGRARDPAEDRCATDDEQDESQQANFDCRAASGDTPKATGGMICSSHTIPFIIISTPKAAKQPYLLGSPEVGMNPANVGLAKLELCLGRAIRAGNKMKKRVLVVDDDIAVRDSLRNLLFDSGYEVSLAADGEEAEQRLATEPIDLLLLDLEMPKRDGWDVFEKLNRSEQVIPVIMITGLADQLDTRNIPGLDALFEKPVDATELLKKIETLLAESADKRLRRMGARATPGYLALRA
jgi:CheY-like chemotaxis protein